MADYKSFDIDSALELPADHFSAETPDSVTFRTRTPLKPITITTGYKDGLGNPQNVTQMTGVIDEVEVRITPTSITSAVRGRDNTAFAIDHFFHKRYLRVPVSPTLTSSFPPPSSPLFIPSVQGQFTASQIAQEVAASVGLKLAWQVPFDYTLVSDFTASGRVIDTIKRLADPFLQIEPFRADIFVQGNTLFVKSRQFPVVPQNVMQITDARRSSMTIRTRKAKKVGVLVLKGGRFPGAGQLIQTVNPSNGQVTISASQSSTSSQHDEFAEGFLVSRTVSTSTFGQPNNVLLTAVKEVFTASPGSQLSLTSRETTTNTYDTAFFDITGGKNQQIISAQTIVREGNDQSDPSLTWRILAKEETGYSYDGNNALLATTTMTSEFDESSGQLLPTKLVTKDYEEISTGIVQETTTVYSFDSDARKWVIQTRDIQTQGGKRPGGPRANPQIPQIEIVVLLSNDQDAVFVEYSNENLTFDQLSKLLAQFKAANAVTWEYEIMFEGVGMPWLKRGASVQFQNITFEDGSLFNMPPAIITEVNTRYDESTPSAQFVQRARAFAWAA